MARSVIKNGDSIKLDYTVRLEDGTVMGSTLDDEPMDVVVGEGELMPGLERALVGLQEGETKTVKFCCDDAFGPRQDELIQEIERSNLPAHFKPVVGQTLELQGDDADDQLTATIVDVSDRAIKIDANHRLAGKDVVVEFRVVEVN